MSWAKVQRVDFKKYKRVIVMSDLHGDYEGFLCALKKVNFSAEDALVIVGDILEKGKDSLPLLRFIMESVQVGNTYMVAGNNDVLLLEWYKSDAEDEAVWKHFWEVKHTIWADMAEEIGMECRGIEDVKRLKSRILKTFAKELCFLQSLPHIIESDEAIFVHAGITSESLEQQDIEYCLSARAFGNQPHSFSKLVVVGHWPVSNYRKNRICVSAYFNRETNVISIDGGVSMKSWQQLNYLIFEHGEIRSGYVDRLPQIQVLEKQEESKEWFTLTFPDTLVVPILKDGEKTLCECPFLHKQIWLDSSSLYISRGQWYCSDTTSYQMPLEAGEIVSYCKKVKNGILVKRDGIVGVYTGTYSKM